MKKTLVALAALAATAAFAQSTVTISGTVDVGVESIADTPVALTSSRSGTSNVTFKGTEDLGGGLKANFQVGSSFDASNSGVAQTTQALGNYGMFVGLSSASMGSIIMGRPVNTLYGFQQTANGTKGVSGFSATDSVTSNGVFTANAVQYVTPSFGGFSAQLEWTASEVAGAKQSNALGLKYANGPLTATFVKADVVATVAGGTYVTINQLGGSYDFGVAKAFATYQDVNVPNVTTDPNAKAYVLGATVPVGPGYAWIQYGRVTVDGRDAASITGLGYKYAMSKRTTIYVNAGQKSNARISNSTFAASNATTAGSGYGIGLQHNF